MFAAAGMAGSRRVGLRYTAVESCLRLHAIARTRWAALFLDLQVMERAALDAWAEQADQDGEG